MVRQRDSLPSLWRDKADKYKECEYGDDHALIRRVKVGAREVRYKNSSEYGIIYKYTLEPT